MWKIKYPVFKKLLNKNLTHSEVILLLYLGMHQDEAGWARGIYFKDVENKTGLSVQSYYNAWRGLEKKEIIRSEKNHSKDRDFKILENNLKTKNFKEGYYNLSLNMFSDPEFSKLKAKEILLAMDILKNVMAGKTHPFKKNTERLIKDYMELFNVKERTIRNYLHSIKKFFNVRIKDKKYRFSAKKSKVYGNVEYRVHKDSEAELYRKHIVNIGCNRAKIGKSNQNEYEDTQHLLVQYKDYGRQEDLAACLIKAIEKSVLKINEDVKLKSEWRYILNCKLVHTLFRTQMGIR